MTFAFNPSTSLLRFAFPSPPLFPFLFEIFPYFQGLFYDDTLKVSTHSLPTFALTLAICCTRTTFATLLLFLSAWKIRFWTATLENQTSYRNSQKRKKEGQEETETQEPVITRIFINI